MEESIMEEFRDTGIKDGLPRRTGQNLAKNTQYVTVMTLQQSTNVSDL